MNRRSFSLGLAATAALPSFTASALADSPLGTVTDGLDDYQCTAGSPRYLRSISFWMDHPEAIRKLQIGANFKYVIKGELCLCRYSTHFNGVYRVTGIEEHPKFVNASNPHIRGWRYYTASPITPMPIPETNRRGHLIGTEWAATSDKMAQLNALSRPLDITG